MLEDILECDQVNVSEQKMSPLAMAAAKDGNIIKAIKIVREDTGLGLKQAKELIERELKHDGGSSSSSPHSSMPISALVALQNGQRIDAIRHYREHNNIGLKDAKKAVEDYLAKNPLTHQGFLAAAAKRRNPVATILWVIVAIGLIVVGGYLVTKN